MKWLIKRFDSYPTTQIHIQQNSQGGRTQMIVQMSGGTAIANLEQHFHLFPQEILSLESFWHNWSQDTNPLLSSSLVIGRREQERERIISWLLGIPSHFRYRLTHQKR